MLTVFVVLKFYILESFTEENRFYSRLEFLNPSQIIVAGGCPMYRGIFNYISGLFPQGSSISLSCDNQKMFPDIAKCLLKGKHAPG